MAVGGPAPGPLVRGWRVADAADGGPGSGVRGRVRPAVGRRARPAPPAPAPEAFEKAEENGEEHIHDRPAKERENEPADPDSAIAGGQGHT